MITRWSARWRKLRRNLSRGEWSVRWLQLPRITGPTDAHGLMMIQIDGLSRQELNKAIRSGRMPFLRSLVEREHYHLHSFYSGLPSSTPSVQGELFYGQKCAVPAFGFRDHRSKQIVRMFIRTAAADVQQRLSSNSQGLLEGGSSYCNIYDGGAAESHFCASSLGWDEVIQTVRPWRLLVVALFHLWSAIRIGALIVIEICLSIVGFLRGATWRELWQELMMIPARIVVVILMRELAVNGAIMDTTRGLPIIHLNLLGYDEQAHRRGPDSYFAHWTLKGIDTAIARLWKAAHRSTSRHYDVWIFSDHGQEKTIPYEFETGYTVQAAVEMATQAVLGGQSASLPDHDDRKKTNLSDRASWLSAGWIAAKLFGEDLVTDADERTTPQVAALGPIGHVYLNRAASTQQRLEIAQRLVTKHKVPLVLVSDDAKTPFAVTADRIYEIPLDADALFADHPFRMEVAADLQALCQHPDAGELVLSGYDGKPYRRQGAETEPRDRRSQFGAGNLPQEKCSLSFVRQNGAHAGFGPSETGAFAMLPCDAPVHVRSGGFIRPLDLHVAAKDFLQHPPRVRPLSPSVHTDDFSIMTYNVHACVGMDGMLSPRRIARVIAQSGADIIALQEIDVDRSRTRYGDQAHEIARYLEMEYEFHPAWQLEEEKYGDAILSRFPMRLIKAGSLPSARPKSEPRGAIWVEVELPNGQQIQVINTHLSIYPAERLLQTKALFIEGWVDQAWNQGPLLLLGDFNARRSSAAYQLLSRRLEDVEVSPYLSTCPTWPSGSPVVQIDHIFTSAEDFLRQDVRVVSSSQAALASDHLPLMATLALTKGAQPYSAATERKSTLGQARSGQNRMGQNWTELDKPDQNTTRDGSDPTRRSSCTE